MKKILTLAFLFIIFTSINFAQARKIDEFGQLVTEDFQVKIERLGMELALNSQAFGQILIYRSEKDFFGYPYKTGAAINSFLTPVGRNRLIVTPCKAEENRRFELWIVPKLEELRTCQADVPNVTKTTLFDNSFFDNPEMGSCCLIDEFGDAEVEASITAFAKILKENPNIRGYLFLYLGTNVYGLNGRKVRKLDSPKLMREMSKTAKRILIENGIEPSRLVLINGGYKDSARNIELWFVPKGEKPPKPKPNYFPKKK